MHSTMNTQYLKIVISLFLCYHALGSTAKFNSLSCKSFKPEWIEIKECRIKAVNRTTNVINLRLTLKQTVKQPQLAFKLLKRERGGWHPFLYDMMLDICAYFKNPNKYVVANLMYSYVEPFTNMNHCCPYKADTDIYLSEWQLGVNSVISRFPIDFGQYGMHTSLFSIKKLLIQVNGSIMYSQF